LLRTGNRNLGFDSSIKCVVFDAGGVLLTLGGDDYTRELAQALGLETLPPRYGNLFPELQDGSLPEDRFWTALAGKPVDMARIDQVFVKYHRPQPAMLELAKELRTRGVKTAVLSNTQTSHARLMREMGVFSGFDPVLLSCEIGKRKPKREAFLEVLKRVRLSASSCAFVDDTEENVEAASCLGFHGILYSGNISALRAALELSKPPQ